MIKIIFDLGAVGERAGSVSARAYILALKKFHGIESLITYEKNHINNNNKRISEMKSEGLLLVDYSKESDLHAIGKNWGATHSYFYTGGEYSTKWVENTKKLTHAVFPIFEPHGDAYNYVSEWMYKKAMQSKKMRTKNQKYRELMNAKITPYILDSDMPISWVPFIVDAKNGNENEFRSRYNIPLEAKLVGRIGGFKQFDDRAAQQGVIELCDTRPDVYFVFVNTEKFYRHKNLIFLDYLSEQDKWDFYSAGNVFINGRLQGEGFGYSICEPLAAGKPIIAPHTVRNFRMDKFHCGLLSGQNLLYKSKEDFKRKLLKQLNMPRDSKVLIELVKNYKPEHVINKFMDKFFIDK
jgi:hypothetical protein